MFVAPLIEEKPISLAECPVRGGGTRVVLPLFFQYLESQTNHTSPSDAEDSMGLNQWTQKWPSDTDEW